MNLKYILCLCFLFIVHGKTATADQTLSPDQVQRINIPGQGPKSLFMILGIDTSKDAVEKAVEKFGKTVMEEGRHFYKSVCYGNKSYIKFENFLGGAGFTLSSTADKTMLCSITKKIPEKFCNEFGICPGFTKQQIENLFRTKFIRDNIVINYHTNTIHDGVPFDLSTTIILIFRDNILRKFAVRLSETS